MYDGLYDSSFGTDGKRFLLNARNKISLPWIEQVRFEASQRISPYPVGKAK